MALAGLPETRLYHHNLRVLLIFLKCGRILTKLGLH